MVTDRYQRVVHHPSINELVAYSRNEGLTIVAVDNVGESTPIETTTLPRDCVILFGQEGPGLSAEALEAADMAVEITQFGSTRSLNASAAAAIVMHRWIMTHAELPGE